MLCIRTLKTATLNIPIRIIAAAQTTMAIVMFHGTSPACPVSLSGSFLSFAMNIFSKSLKKYTALSRELMTSTKRYTRWWLSAAPSPIYHLLKNPARGGIPTIESDAVTRRKDVRGIFL